MNNTAIRIGRYKLLGIDTNALSISDLNQLIAAAVNKDEKWIIANHNLHSIYIYHRDPKMRDFYSKADYVHIDGMPLVLVGRLLGYPLRREQRVTYADWIWPLASDAEKHGWRIFYLGSRPGVAAEGAEVLCRKYSDLQITTAHGYFNKENLEENQAILDAINTYKPNVLMVGMSMPRQEHWILENLDLLQANIILTSGACLDYVAGEVPTPPRWMGELGLEWSYRLLTAPKHVWQRYLIEPWFVLYLFLKDLLFVRPHKNQPL
ncbi:MAG: WecB/TagA/CpsF family glycosyltransferase [Cyanobacteria bacterium J06636_16]